MQYNKWNIVKAFFIVVVGIVLLGAILWLYLISQIADGWFGT